MTMQCKKKKEVEAEMGRQEQVEEGAATPFHSGLSPQRHQVKIC